MNENKYKETFNAIFPSEEAVERIYANTIDKKKFTYKKVVKRIAATAMAFVLAIGIGFGIDFIKENNYLFEHNYTEPNSNKPSSTESNNETTESKLGILVAYAGEKDYLQIQNAFESQKLFGKLYVAFHSDEEELQRIYNESDKEEQKVLGVINKCLEKGEEPAMSYYSTIDYIYDQNDPDEKTELGWVISIYEGELTLNLDDYSNVKDITFENSSKYVELMIEYYTWKPTPTLEGHKITVTGEELKYAIDHGIFLPKGYIFSWHIANPLLEELAADENFDLSNIKDTITFTVNYLDGTTEKTSVDLTFDKDGNMRLSDNTLMQ